MALAVQHTREHANDQVVVLEPHVALRGHLALALDAWLGVPAEGEEKGDGSSAELDRRLLVLEVKGVEYEGAHLVQLCISLDVLSSGSRAWDWIGPTGSGSLARERSGSGRREGGAILTLRLGKSKGTTNNSVSLELSESPSLSMGSTGAKNASQILMKELLSSPWSSPSRGASRVSRTSRCDATRGWVWRGFGGGAACFRRSGG